MTDPHAAVMRLDARANKVDAELILQCGLNPRQITIHSLLASKRLWM